MKPIFYLLQIFIYFSWVALSENPRKNSDEENGCAFYCFLVPNQTEKIDQNKELEPYKNLSCTHLVYAFAHVDNRSWTVAGPTLWDTPDVEWEGNYKAVASLHEWSNMTVLLGIFQSGKLSFIASPWSREKFAKEVVKAARWHNFQGIFFYFQSGEHFEESQFLEFLETLKHELDSDAETIRGQRDGRLQVVLSIGSKSVTKSSEKFPKIEPYFDGFYLIMDDSPPPNENHSLASQIDPLFATSGNQTIASEETISFIAEEIVESGIPRHKLIIGLNVWTNSFVLDNPNITGHGAKVISQGNASVTGKTDGKLAYFEICDLKNASEIEYDDIAETTSFSADDSWFSLNIPGHPSFEKKLNWIAKNKFGGVGLASLKADDQDGKCGEGLFPVHNYVGKHFRCSWSNDETDEDNNKPTVCTRLCIIRPENAPNEFSLSNMEPQWCSHIVISSAKILSLPGSLYLSDKMKQLVDDYKQWNVEGKPKLIISIGAHEIPDNWRVYLFTRYRRQILIDSIKKVLLDTEAEGVDISWTRGHLDSAKDTEIFILFVEELKKQIGQQFLIFVEVTPQSTFNERYDFVRMNRSVDFIIAQGHRFHSHKKAFTGHHSPLFMAEDLIDIRMNIEGFTSELVKRGVPKEKLIVGLSAEAMGMHLMVGERGETEIGAPSSPFDHVKRRNMPGEVSQSDVCLSLEKNSTISKFHPKIGVPYLIDGFEFIAYDDVHSIQLKTIWTSMNGYGGIALFGVEMDNVDGECPKREPYQLLKTIVDAQICEVCAKQKIRDHQNSSSPLASSANSCTKSSFQVLCGYRLAKEDGTEPLEAYMIPYQKCTEIVVEEAIWDADGELRYEESAQDSLRDLVQFHTQHQNNSKLVSAIRCNMTEQEFINFIGDNERFVEKILSHMNLFGYSGIEFRCKDVITAETNSAFSSMLENLQRNFKTAKSSNECKKTVGIRIPAHTNNLKSFYNISALNKLHSIVIDSFPSPSNYSELLNPLFGVGLGGEFVTLDSTIKNWIIEGVDPRKIVFSIPAYGTWQQLKNSSNHDLGEPVEDAIDLLTQELLYKKFKQLGITDRKFVYEAVGAYATTIDDEFLSYETPETVGYKVKYAIRENLGGVAIDSLNHEDFNNVSTTGPFPLLEAIDLNKCFV